MKHALVITACVLFALPVLADTLTLNDGRTFEGRVIAETPEKVTIDAMVSGIRATLAFPTADVKQVDRNELSDDFFNIQASATLVSDPDQTGTPYLVVPVTGSLGQDVLAEGLDTALNFAAQRGVADVVFTVNSTGGDLDEARAIAAVLDKYDDALKYHALVQNAKGLGLMFPVWSDTVHVVPTAEIGGLSLADLDRDDLDADLAASRAAAVAEKHGHDGQLVKAMILPDAGFAAWTDDEGNLQTGRVLPEGVLADRVILEDNDGTELVLSADEAVGIGFAKAYDGTVDQLGDRLEAQGWRSVSDFGGTAMQQAVARAAGRERHAAALAERHAQQVAKNVQQHGDLISYILANLMEYRDVEPSQGQYATYVASSRYRTRYRGGYGWGRYYTAYRPTNRYTQDSRREWQLRTDAAVAALRRVRSAIGRLDRLDREAVKLGVERDTNAELSEALTDKDGKPVNITTRALASWAGREIGRLNAQRNRRGE